jgi:hypothetical protein
MDSMSGASVHTHVGNILNQGGPSAVHRTFLLLLGFKSSPKPFLELNTGDIRLEAGGGAGAGACKAVDTKLERLYDHPDSPNARECRFCTVVAMVGPTPNNGILRPGVTMTIAFICAADCVVAKLMLRMH